MFIRNQGGKELEIGDRLDTELELVRVAFPQGEGGVGLGTVSPLVDVTRVVILREGYDVLHHQPYLLRLLFQFPFVIRIPLLVAHVYLSILLQQRFGVPEEPLNQVLVQPIVFV